eukprot:CAMPEP_0206223810 /NCGR_PEP_ID=MMETSP0047_2-20121206/6686_1 /ASSEMBLY_ACC=CAM_ASM_000192 /TAXON_ID=195065 /ORGANISM="Chroomonas mesostigmatica_cf, Strain CCMP1168" /LENGTH=362 /DNA_ID=CAMNT_0053646715 /DNA_START=89 /DNA_END=1177 /DNA_ORIENTATION=-
MLGIGSALVNRYVGHNEWVKNVEPLDRRTFLSSSLQGTVRAWDTASDGAGISGAPAGARRNDNVILRHDFLTRMALSDDGGERRMVVSFADGSVVIVHKLDVPMQSRADRTATPHMIASRRSLDHVLLLQKQQTHWHAGFGGSLSSVQRRPRDYFRVPDECYSNRNRLELLQEPRNGCTSSLTVSRHSSERQLLLSRRTTTGPMDQLCVYRLDGRLPAGYQRRRAALVDAESASAGGKRKRTTTKIASASEASRLFPPRLLAMCEESPTQDFFVDAALSSCGRLICSPHNDTFRVLEASQICDRGGADDLEDPLVVGLDVLYTGKRAGESDTGTAVLTTAFHPHLLACASGSLDGKIRLEAF